MFVRQCLQKFVRQRLDSIFSDENKSLHCIRSIPIEIFYQSRNGRFGNWTQDRKSINRTSLKFNLARNIKIRRRL